ncbi:uncharacterized protein LOC100556457 isoform X2 [Anolis carolinensis]|uniref:uncharacterized protein LOC100556457 isoform X2 n=2 Tax=Anolis carolinensis TaxID=28377 RepID=UPI002F2B80D3
MQHPSMLKTSTLMDFAAGPDWMEGLRHRFMNCTVEPGTQPPSETNFKDTFHIPADGLPGKKGQMASQIADDRQNERNCVKGAFGVSTTTGSRKLKRRSTAFHHKPSDSGVSFWEEVSIHSTCNANAPSDRWHQRARSSVTNLKEELEDGEEGIFERPGTEVSPSKGGRHYDIDMETTGDIQTANESLRQDGATNLPQRLSGPSELPRGLGYFAEALTLVPNHSLMDVEPSQCLGSPPNTRSALLSKPLPAEPNGDVVMREERKIKKSKEIPILDRVGETLRQKKLRATQA